MLTRVASPHSQQHSLDRPVLSILLSLPSTSGDCSLTRAHHRSTLCGRRGRGSGHTVDCAAPLASLPCGIQAGRIGGGKLPEDCRCCGHDWALHTRSVVMHCITPYCTHSYSTRSWPTSALCGSGRSTTAVCWVKLCTPHVCATAYPSSKSPLGL